MSPATIDHGLGGIGDHATDCVVDLCSRLLGFDTSNYGCAGSAGEGDAARFVANPLRDMGVHPVMLESAATPANVVVRVPGMDPTLPALLVQGHLDVVPRS